MPRDASGTYSLPPNGNPVISGTTIQSTWANSTLSDVASALTDSLSRNGQGGMLGPFYFANGTVSAPAASFAEEQTSGLYRASTSDLRMSITGTDVMRWVASPNVPQLYINSIWQNIATVSDIPSAVDPGTAISQTLRWDNVNLKWIPSDVLKTGPTGVTVNGTGGVLVQGTGAVTVNGGGGVLVEGTGGISVTGDGGLSVTGTAGLLSTGAGTNSFRAGTSAGATTQGASSIAIGQLAGETGQGANGIIINSSGAVLNDIDDGHIHIASDLASIDYTATNKFTLSDNLNVTGNITATGTITANSGVMIGEIKFLTVLPVSPATLPFGWHQADGSNGTENLVGRFLGAIGSGTSGAVLSAGANGSAPTNPDTGLAGAETLTILDAGSHNHSVSISGQTSDATEGGFNDDGNHRHVLSNTVTVDSGGGGASYVVAKGGSTITTDFAGKSHSHPFTDGSSTTTNAGVHNHVINDVPDHFHTTSGNTLPPYFGMFVIQYTGA